MHDHFRPDGYAIALSIVLLLTAGCDQGKKQNESEQAPATASAAAAGPVSNGPARKIEVIPAKVAEGKKAYQNCVGCHGEEGEGRVGMAPKLASQTFLQAASDDMLVNTITHGRTGTTMVGWGQQLGNGGIENVVAYIRSLAPTKPVDLDESPLKGDAVNGEKLFTSICANCHGRTGAGYQESGSGTGIGRKAFLNKVSNGFLRYVIKNGKSGTKMRPFAEQAVMAVANLKDSEIEDIIAYMRKNAW